MVKSVPHSWLFLQVAAVVHHGGAGTTAAGPRAGVPSIVILFFGDRLFWGQRVAKLVLGQNPFPGSNSRLKGWCKPSERQHAGSSDDPACCRFGDENSS
jgi:hypothetical protein